MTLFVIVNLGDKFLSLKYNILKDAFSIKNSESCRYDSLNGYISDFSRNGDVDGWDIYSNICIYGVWKNILFGTSLDRSCFISRYNIFLPIPAEKYYVIKLTMKFSIPDNLKTIPTKGRIMWLTNSDSTWDTNKTKDFDLQITDQWYTYVLNMGESQYWVGNINNLRIYPFIDGKPDIRFIIKSIRIDSINDFKCLNTQCSYYTNYSHPCPGAGVKSSITSSISTDRYSLVAGETDKLIINIDSYGEEQLNLGTHTNLKGSDMAKVLVNNISAVSFGQYAYADVWYDETQKKLTIRSGSNSLNSTIAVKGPAALALGFDENSEQIVGTEPASGFDYAASRRLKGFEINSLVDASTDRTAYYHNPNQYTVEAGRRDFEESMSSSHAPRSININYYDYLNGDNKLLIDGSHPINDSGRLNLIKVNGVRMRDKNKSTISKAYDEEIHLYSNTASKIVLIRPFKNGDAEIINEVELSEINKNSITTTSDVTYSVDVDWLVNKGDLIGFYNIDVLCPFSLYGRVMAYGTQKKEKEKANAVYFAVDGIPEGVFTIGKPKSQGVIGMSFYARSSRMQDDIKLDIDLGKRFNIKEFSVYGVEFKTFYEYNIAACLDINWQVNLYNDTHKHEVWSCFYELGRIVVHRNKYYGLEALSDCITTPDNGEQGQGYSRSSLGGPIRVEGSSRLQDSDPDTYHGLATIGTHCYFYVNGDAEWLNGGCSSPSDPESDYWKNEFVSPWYASAPFDYEYDPIAFTLFFPYNKNVAIHKTGIYFKESNNFKYISLSYYTGENGPTGNAEELHFQYVPEFTYITVDGTTMDLLTANGSVNSNQYTEVYFKNPWPWGKIEIVDGVVTNGEIYQTIANERKNIMMHEFEPINCEGFRIYTSWHKSTKISEMEVYSSMDILPSLLDNINVQTSIYGDDWFEIPFMDDELNSEHIKGYINGSPRYFRLHLKSEDLFNLKELSCEITEEDLKSLDCTDTLLLNNAPKNIITASQEVVLENSYDVPLNVIVDIPKKLFKSNALLSWIKCTSEENTINAEVGPGATIRKNDDYEIFLEKSQIANNCPSYYLKNLIDGKLSYVLENNSKWKFFKTLNIDELVDYENKINSNIYTTVFDAVSSKYWKLGTYSETAYSLDGLTLYKDDVLIIPDKIYIQMQTDKWSGKFETSLDQYGKILPVTLIEDDFSDGQFLDKWEYNLGLSTNNSFVESDSGLRPFLSSWQKIYIEKEFMPGTVSFNLDVQFNFTLPNKLKYSIELYNPDEQLLFVFELSANDNNTINIHLFCVTEPNQILLAGTTTDNPFLYKYSDSVVYTGAGHFSLSINKVQNYFKQIVLECADRGILYNGLDLISFIDRISKVRIVYENISSHDYHIASDWNATKYFKFDILPYFSADEFIGFSFNNSEPVDKIKLIHSEGNLDFFAVLISSNDNDNYEFFARNFNTTSNIGKGNNRIYTKGFYFPWGAFKTLNNLTGQGQGNELWLKYDLGAGNYHIFNKIFFNGNNPWAYRKDFTKISVFGTNKYGETFSTTDTDITLLTEFNINYSAPYNTIDFLNLTFYRFIIIYWQPIDTAAHNVWFNNPIKLMYTYSTSVRSITVSKETYYNYFAIDLGKIHNLDLLRNYDSPSAYILGDTKLLNIDNLLSIEYSNSNTSDIEAVNWESHKGSARWVKIPLLCGDGSNTEQSLRLLGIYPNISVATLPTGEVNCEWIAIPNNLLTNYGETSINLSPYATVFNLGTINYNFENGLTGEWSNLSYVATSSSGIIGTDFALEYPDSIWKDISINFTGPSFTVYHDQGLIIDLDDGNSGNCSFKTDNFYGDCSCEIAFNHNVNSISTGQMTTDLVIYLADSSKRLVLRRIVYSANSVQFLVNSTLNSQAIFSNADFDKISKFRIEKSNAYIKFLYYDKITYSWAILANYLATDFEFSEVFFTIEITKSALFPKDLIEIEYININNRTFNELDLSLKRHYADNTAGDPQNVVDGSISTSTYCQGMHYIAVDLEEPIAVNSFRVASYNINTYNQLLIDKPYFQGSNDSTNGEDGTWYNLVQVTPSNHGSNSSFPSYSRNIIFLNTIAYRWYRLNGFAGTSNSILTEWEFYENTTLMNDYYSTVLWGISTESDLIVNKFISNTTPNMLIDYGPLISPVVLSDGEKINYFEFEYCSSFGGGGFSILDSNNEEIIGVASFAPSWGVKSNIGWEFIFFPTGNMSNVWYNVKVTFDWLLYKATIFWQDTSYTYSQQKTVDLIKQTNVSKFQIRNTFGKDWGSDFTDIKFDNIVIDYDRYTMQDWLPDNCISGNSEDEGFDQSWGFSASDPKPTIILDFGQLHSINKFVLYHRPIDNNTSWLNTAYTISLATSISGTFDPVIDITNNTDSVSTHYLTNTIEAEFVKLEINAYTKPSIPPVVSIYNREGEIDNVVIDGGFLREFEVWNGIDIININSQQHPIVCINLKDQFNISGHDVVCNTPGNFIVPAYKDENIRWSNNDSVYQYSSDITDIPNNVSFGVPGGANYNFFFNQELLDQSMIGGPFVIGYQVYLAYGSYKVYWELNNVTVAESVELTLSGPETLIIKPLYFGSDWKQQINSVLISNSGYYSIQIKVSTHFPDQIWGVRNVYFSIVDNTSKWVALRRTCALNFTQNPTTGYEDGRIDYLSRVKIYSSDKIKPTEHSWWWVSGNSTLSEDSINTKVGKRALRIEYPNSTATDYIRFKEGDNFGLDERYSIKDFLCFWLYIEDINKIDIESSSIVFGCFDGWMEDSVSDAQWADSAGDERSIAQTMFVWFLKNISLVSGWNRVRLRFDQYDYIFPEPDENTGDLSNYLNYRNYLTSSFAINFKGTGQAFYMLLDDLKIERNWFDDEVSFEEKGLCLTWDEFVEIPLSYVNLQIGTIEMWLKLYSTTTGKDHYGDIKSKTIFTLVGNSNDSITLNISEGNWFEFGFGNIKSAFSSTSVSANTYDLSGFSFDIDDVVHIALVWDALGLEMDNGDTMRLYVNGTKCLTTSETWEVTDNKGALLRLGGGNTYLASNSTNDGSAIFSNVKIYNFCKEEFDINNQVSTVDNLLSPNELVFLSEDNVEFFTNNSVKLPLVYKEVMPGDKITLYVKFDKTKMDLMDGVTGTLSIDWQIPV